MRRLAVPLLLAAGTLGAQPSHSPRPLELDEALAVRRFADRTPLALSPDARLVAFTMSDPRRLAATAGPQARYFTATGATGPQRASEVLVVDTRTGTTRSLGGARAASWGPVWSPDGRRLAFYSDRDGRARVWVWDRERDALRRLSDAVVRPYFEFEQIRWSPAGDRVLVKLLPAGETIASAARGLPSTAEARELQAARAGRDTVTARVFSSLVDSAPGGAARTVTVDGVRSFMNVSLADLATIDVATGAVRRLARRARPMLYRFSPDGGAVLMTSRRPYDAAGGLTWSLYETTVLDTLGRVRARLPLTTQEYGLGASWSPDGRRVALADDDSLLVVAVDGGAVVAHLSRRGASLAHEYRAPLWRGNDTLVVAARDTLWRLPVGGGEPAGVAAPNGHTLIDVVASPDAERLDVDRAVLVATRERATKRVTLRRLDLRAGTDTLLHALDVALSADPPYAFDRSPDGRAVALAAESGDRPGEVWVGEGDAAPRRVTSLHAEVTGLALGTSRLVRWTTARGDTLRGALLLPAGYVPGRRYPLVVRVYGGSALSSTVHTFGLMAGVDNHQLFATRGYAVLLPDTPLRVGTPLADLAADVLPALDSVVAMGVADPERIGVIGHSYGGYSVLALLVQTGRFRAAVSSGGMGDLFGHYARMRSDGSATAIGWAERDQGRMGASPWEARDRYLANSPYFFLDRVTTPVLLVHGAGDPTVSVGEAEQTFVALRRLGKPAVLVEYAGEGHHQSEWGAANVHDYWTRVLGWFDHHLGAARPAEAQ